MILADILNGAVITIEHLVMVVLGGAGASIIAGRLSKLRIQVNGRLTGIDKRLDELEAEKASE